MEGLSQVLLCVLSCWYRLRLNIYNGNIFPSLNPAKIFQFIYRWTESTKSSAVGPNYRAVINTSNEVKSPLPWEFWIYNFSPRILERVLGWKHCKYKEWVSFFLGSWGMNRSAEQTNRPRTASQFTRFVCPALRFIPHEPRKKDTHSLKELDMCLCNMDAPDCKRHLPLYHTPSIQKYVQQDQFSVYGNIFLMWFIQSQNFVFSLKHVQCSRIHLNGGVLFITFRVHVYKML